MCPISELRKQFPFFNTSRSDSRLIYLDSGATSQKPQQVIEAVNSFYREQNANVHRGLHLLSAEATSAFEQAREKVAKFLNVQSKEIVWTSGATDSINIIANGLKAQLEHGDIICISSLEHHANIVPWQELCKEKGCTLKILPITESGILNLQLSIELILELSPKIVAISHASNALGNIQPVEKIIEAAHEVAATTVVDGAQAFMHLRPDLRKLDCDFYVFSAHKALGPTGLGVLYGKYNRLNALNPLRFGGEMIKEVSFDQTSFQEAPSKFEAGTPNISAVIGFSAALDFLNSIDHEELQQYEQRLYEHLLTQLRNIGGIIIYGDTENNIGTVSFRYKNEHHFDLATFLNGYGIAIRNGHHCTQPLMKLLGIDGTIRVSLAFYNNHDDIDAFIHALKESIDLLEI